MLLERENSKKVVEPNKLMMNLYILETNVRSVATENYYRDISA